MSNDLLMEPEAQCTLVSNKTLWRTPVKVKKNKQVICDVSMLCCYCITAGGHRLVTGEQTNSQVGPNKVLLKTVIQRLSWQLQGIKVATTIFFLLLFFKLVFYYISRFQTGWNLKSVFIPIAERCMWREPQQQSAGPETRGTRTQDSQS